MKELNGFTIISTWACASLLGDRGDENFLPTQNYALNKKYFI